MSGHFVDSILYKIITYIYAFFITNLLFILSNILLVIVIFDFNLISTWLFLFIALLPLGPAFGALFYSMGKLVREGDINPIKAYMKGYALNFKIAFSFGLIQSLLLTSLGINLGFVFSTFWMAILFMLLITLLFMVSLYGFAILSRFEMKLKNLCFLSIYLTFKCWPMTLYNFIVTAFVVLTFNLFPAYVLPFFASVYVYWIMKNLKNTLAYLEESKEKNQNA